MNDAPPIKAPDIKALATYQQRQAASPDSSVWVSANAGSGKTKVLVDRVARLLLEGARPNAILCLTFTKAAAAEMAQRLQKRLGGWALSPQDKLESDLAELLGRAAKPKEIKLARRAFAHALDVPGGLTIQTIHSFCESLLKRFPLEAKALPNFSVADERTAQELLDMALDQTLIARAGRPADDPESLRLFQLALAQNEAGIRKTLMKALAQRRRLMDFQEKAAHAGMTPRAAIFKLFDLDEQATVAELKSNYEAVIDRETWRAMAATLMIGKNQDKKRSINLANYLEHDQFEEWKSFFFTGTGKYRKNNITKDLLVAHPEWPDLIEAEGHRLAIFLDRYKACSLAEISATLTQLATEVLDCYAALKAQRAFLDYDDLILKSAALLADPGLAPWVLYKLDHGLDHILVDEAQDTSPEQWKVIAAIAEEFFAGQSARAETKRTLFVVGDEKQSIFSFQGADPAAFADMRDRFAHLTRAAQQDWQPISLGVSFRSASAILRAVDAVFGRLDEGGYILAQEVSHQSSKAEAGLVELWPLFVSDEKEESKAWDAPLDQKSEASGEAKLAEAIAIKIKGWIDRGEALRPGGRAIHAGDVMILLRKRNAFFNRLVRTLKKHGLPVAGVDRLTLAEDIAVMDLIALGSFLLLPRDDYALACVLKSPLYGLNDEDLFLLRTGGKEKGFEDLWPALRRRADERPAWRYATDEIAALLAQADYQPPFEFYGGLLGARGGRRRFLSRLGPEAGEALDAFLALTLTFEREHGGGLQAFLHWLRRSDAQVKRDLDQAKGEIRILTVHAAKGLEAPIVFLPDICHAAYHSSQSPDLFWAEDRIGGKDKIPILIAGGSVGEDDALRAQLRAAQKAQEIAESRRLLYVAMTRAEDRLYMAGYQSNKRQIAQGNWHGLIEKGLLAAKDITKFETPLGDGLRLADYGFESGETPSALDKKEEESPPPSVPAHLRRPAPTEARPPKPLSPSQATPEPGGRNPIAEDGLRFARGRIIHRLLQFLPDLPITERAAAARHWLAQSAQGLTSSAQNQIAEEVLALFEHPGLTALLDPGAQARAEAPIAGLVGTHVVSGQIDRLVIGTQEVLVLDYKSNRPSPQRPEEVERGYILQMALYRALLVPLFPDKVIRCGLVWTDRPNLMMIEDKQMDESLAGLTRRA